ncbi:putative ribonuclease H-like domain-containing protein [Tanacetum coccineum]|uniref:Ribonuclease H-like domain-containing protein n=1 Tax=Tanacetum coccineum TaxID=301880 RepID=A0ABQ5IX56_9ASTR
MKIESLIINAASIEDNAVDEDIVYRCAHDLNIPNLKEIVYSDDDKGIGAEADMTNLDTHILEQKKMKEAFVIRHKAWVVAQGLHLRKGELDYDEMDVKSAFLYGKIEEEVYVCQTLRFEDLEFPDKVYKVEKALYGLHQAPRACQDMYVDEILKKFGFSTMKTASTPMETSKPLLKDAKAKNVDVHLYRSMIGSLMYLIALRHDIIFADSPFDLEAYTDSDYAGASLDRKSTTGGCQFLRSRLISWQCKKQTVVANSTTEVENVAASSCCGQSSGPIYLVADETIYKECKDRMERAVTTTSSLEAEQDSGNINRTQSMAKLNESFPQGTSSGSGPRVNTLRSGEDNMKLKELMEIKTDRVISEQKEMRDIVSLKTERELERINIDDGNNFWNEIRVNAGVSKLMLLSINLLLPVLVYATKHILNAVRHDLTAFWTTAKAKTFNEEHQIQALVDKRKVIITEKSIRSDLKFDDAERTNCLPTTTIFAEFETMGYENFTQKRTFYKAYFSSQWKFLIHTILQCLSAKITAWNEFSSTMASAIICLATNQKFNFSKYIFYNMVKNLEGGVKFLMYPRFVQVFMDKQIEGMSKHKGIYVISSHTKKVFSNMKREGKGFSSRITLLFPTMMVQAPEDMGVDLAAPTDCHSTPIITQPSSSQPQKKKSRRKQRKDSGSTEPVTNEAINKAHISTPSYDQPPSGEDRMQLNELMTLCTSLQEKVLNLEKAKTAQAKEIASLKKRVKQLEKRRKSRTLRLKRLRKVGSSNRVESSNDVSLGAQEDAFKQGRKITDLDADAEVTLVDETQEMHDDNLMFDTGVLDEQEIWVEKVVIETKEPLVNTATTSSIPVSTADLVTTAGEVVTTISASTKTIDEITLAQTLIEIKAAKPKVVTTAATTVTPVITRPKAKGVVIQEPSETTTTTTAQPSSNDKGKCKMVKPEKPMKKKDQIALDEELTLNLHAKEQAELERM